MPENRPRTPRTLLIPDHLWEALDAMASEMGNDRDALINQALYTFARLNGFLVPSDVERLASDDAEHAPGGYPTPRELSPANGRANVEVHGSPLLQEEGIAPTSMDLPNLAELGLPRRGRQPEQSEETPSPPPGRVLVLFADGR